ncbi:helix-turn-helix domain-containing protein [Flammeovirga kamogawensis]|uniref:AraC family transcriptional regulator n=2 Tax=Flammeovirga kamogawensis TaxID=373891 RepID=A0ABX8H0U4_9BACT|nr:AraC family transcriptional regulator [Flammeovirga kamogawensis]QWG09304.1 AraC family transcriptional regulator [Flammeovirga kamogawensis]
MSKEIIKTKVNLNMHMFSFLQKGKKEVHYADRAVTVNEKQSILLRKGNCLWSELLDPEENYYCKLLFFTEERLSKFITEYIDKETAENEEIEETFFCIENDNYLTSYIDSLFNINEPQAKLNDKLLSIKFDELLIYLLRKYGKSFEKFLLSLESQKKDSSFKVSVEQNIFSSLSLEEIAFLCNMSLSTFKRHFKLEYNISPGKWLRDKRLEKAKELLEMENRTPSDIYMDLGYHNLSNFSNAFKKKFGVSPTEIA